MGLKYPVVSSLLKSFSVLICNLGPQQLSLCQDAKVDALTNQDLNSNMCPALSDSLGALLEVPGTSTLSLTSRHIYCSPPAP